MRIRVTLAVDGGFAQDANVFTVSTFDEAELNFLQKMVDAALTTNDNSPRMYVEIIPNTREVPVTMEETMGEPV